MKKYRVRIINEAELDLADIYTYIARDDSPEKADHVLEKLETLSLSLAEMPERGHIPPELDRIGVTGFLEVHFKPYRIVYQIAAQDVFIHCVLDGRRDMQSILQRRLLR